MPLQKGTNKKTISENILSENDLDNPIKKAIAIAQNEAQLSYRKNLGKSL